MKYRRARRCVKRDDIGIRGNLQGNFVTLFSARLCIGRAIRRDHHGVPFLEVRTRHSMSTKPFRLNTGSTYTE